MKSLMATLFLLAAAGAHAADVTASVGVSKLSLPPSGTWWEDGQAHSFRNVGPSFGVGLRGRSWSVEATQIGTITSSATACAGNEPACTSGKQAMSHWYGVQRPRGVWGAWEPHYGPLFLQIGGGVYNPGFDMHIPDYPVTLGNPLCPNAVCNVGNHRLSASWLGGFGVSAGRLDFIANIRRIAAVGPETNTDNFHGLSKTAITASVRLSF